MISSSPPISAPVSYIQPRLYFKLTIKADRNILRRNNLHCDLTLVLVQNQVLFPRRRRAPLAICLPFAGLAGLIICSVEAP